MFPIFSDVLLRDVAASLESALGRSGIVNIASLAEEIRVRNADENVAVEDIAHELMRRAQTHNAIMEFDATPAGR
ncbi:MAG: hypothetical protein AB7S80_06105 [Rhizobiaceae bacterium]